MSQVITFVGYFPSPRFDSIPWTEARIEEGTTSDGPWTQIDVITLSPVDADPAHPAERNFTTELASDTPELWYRIVFADATADTLQPTEPVQNESGRSAFASAEELFRILKIRAPSTEQTAAAERVIHAAYGEILAEIDLSDDETSSDLESWELALCAQVNLDRAADLWRHTESIPGVTGLLGDEGGMVTPGRYSWERYAQRLAPIKKQWGIA